MSKTHRKPFLYLSALALVAAIALADMKQPKTVTLSGTLIDLTCASKGKAMMNSWQNVGNDHMMPDGKIKNSCAKLCLTTGQPAALWSNNQIRAVLACDPKTTLANFAGEKVEVQGFWAGDGKEVKTLVPTKIRQGAGEWKDVVCQEMHM